MKNSILRYHDLLVLLVWEIQTIYDLFKNDQQYEHLLDELKKYDIEDRERPHALSKRSPEDFGHVEDSTHESDALII